MGSAAVAAGLATVVAALVAGITGWLTAKASAKGATKAAAITSLTDLEREAGTRAFGYWEAVVEDQRREHDQDRAEIDDLKAKRREDRATIADQQRQIDALTREVRECRALCRRLATRDDPPDDSAD